MQRALYSERTPARPPLRHSSPHTRLLTSAAPVLLLVLCLFPVAFVAWAWVQSNGLPYFRDSNETYLSYAHARALTRFSLRDTMLLTFEDSDLGHVTPTFAYTHNPNLPRYANYLLLLLGIQPLQLHTLIIAIAGTLGAMLALRATLAGAVPDGLGSWIVLPLVFALDSSGFLTWTVNTYRVFAFVLLWGSLAAVVRPAPGWIIASAAFFLFQFEYAFAAMTFVAAVLFAVLRHGRQAVYPSSWLIAGATLSLTVFGSQVIAYLGPAGAWAELSATVQLRSAAPITLPELWDTTVSAIMRVYRWPIWQLTIWSMVTAPFVIVFSRLARGRSWWSTDLQTRVLLAQLQLALVAGVTVSALLLRGYFVGNYSDAFSPCLVFPITVGIATAALDLALVLTMPLRLLRTGAPWLAPTLRAAAFAVATGLMLANFGRVWDQSPPMQGEFIKLLQTTYREQPFVGTGNYHLLAHALTGGSAMNSPLVITEKELPSYESIRTPDGRLYYLCVTNPIPNNLCHRAGAEMMVLGHTVTDQGPDFTIVELVRNPVPVAAPPPPNTQPASRPENRSRPRRNR